MSDQEDFLRYYKQELSYLRHMGRLFSQSYPKLAGRLELSATSCADPHVERLIESFAFLTARLQRQMDSEFPEISGSLLSVLYPHLVNPVPPIAIARFDVDPDQGKLTTGYEIAKNTQLFTETPDGLTCKFRTCYPVTLWPLEVVYAGLESKDQFSFLDHDNSVAAVLRVQVRAARGTQLRDLELTSLRFHLNGDLGVVNELYELLFCETRRVTLLPEFGARPVDLPADCIRPVGFAPDEDVIPYPDHSHAAYRLLQEYFCFPGKYLFFDLHHLDLLKSSESNDLLDILILLNRVPHQRMAIQKHTFALGCTPIINLFPKTSEPIRLDHSKSQYRLVADIRRERTTEIHSIISVSSSSNVLAKTGTYAPFYSFHFPPDGRDSKAFWHAQRSSTGRADVPGTEMWLSFLDLNFNPNLPPVETVYAHTLCTNRNLALQVPAGAALQIEETAPLARIICLEKPTPPIYPPLGGAILWRLVSNMSLNYLSLSRQPEALKALQEMLQLYSMSERPSTLRQLNGIQEMKTRRVVRRAGQEAWRGFCTGMEISLTFDEKQFEGSGAFLLGSVLHHFFGLYAAVNSFTQLVIRSQQREGEWKRWAPMVGDQELL